MADIRAFHAMRYTKSAGEAKELTCPPYDIISEAERAAFLERNPHNVIRLELPRGEEPYKTAGKTLHTWLSDGTLRCDKDAGLYIYEEEFKTDVDHGEVRSVRSASPAGRERAAALPADRCRFQTTLLCAWRIFPRALCCRTRRRSLRRKRTVLS